MECFASSLSSPLRSGRHVIFTEPGEGLRDALDHFLRIEDQPAPDPAQRKPDEVIVRVESLAVSRIDLVMAGGVRQDGSAADGVALHLREA